MIIKSNDKFYNCDGWKTISQEDEYVTITFFKTYKDEEGSIEIFENVLELIDDERLAYLSYKHTEWGHKDIRQVKYRLQNKAYSIFMEQIKNNVQFIDLDTLIDQEKLANEAEEEYIKEWQK